MKKLLTKKSMLIVIALVSVGIIWKYHAASNVSLTTTNNLKVGPTFKTEYKMKMKPMGWFCTQFADAEEFIHNFESNTLSGNIYLVDSSRCTVLSLDSTDSPAQIQIKEGLSHVSLVDTYNPGGEDGDPQFKRCKIRVYLTDALTEEAWTQCSILLKGDEEEEYIHIDEQGNLSGWSGATGTQHNARF
jgi:hypothetical protein